MEEIKQMQLLKKKEIEEKIKKLKEITGNAEIAFDVSCIFMYVYDNMLLFFLLVRCAP